MNFILDSKNAVQKDDVYEFNISPTLINTYKKNERYLTIRQIILSSGYQTCLLDFSIQNCSSINYSYQHVATCICKEFEPAIYKFKDSYVLFGDNFMNPLRLKVVNRDRKAIYDINNIPDGELQFWYSLKERPFENINNNHDHDAVEIGPTNGILIQTNQQELSSLFAGGYLSLDFFDDLLHNSVTISFNLFVSDAEDVTLFCMHDETKPRPIIEYDQSTLTGDVISRRNLTYIQRSNEITLTTHAGRLCWDFSNQVGGAARVAENSIYDANNAFQMLRENDSITVCFWMNTNDVTDSTILHIKDNDPNGFWSADRLLVYLKSNKLTCVIATSDDSNLCIYEVDANLANDGAWHHIAVTIGSNNKEIYVDGVASASFSFGNANTEYLLSQELSEQSICSVGCNRNNDFNDGGSCYGGYLSNLKFFNRTLSQSEVEQDRLTTFNTCNHIFKISVINEKISVQKKNGVNTLNIITSTQDVTNTWVHCLLEFKPSENNLYIDGVLDNTSSNNLLELNNINFDVNKHASIGADENYDTKDFAMYDFLYYGDDIISLDNNHIKTLSNASSTNNIHIDTDVDVIVPDFKLLLGTI